MSSSRALANALGKACTSNFPNQRVEVRVHALDVLLVGDDAIMGAASADARTSKSPVSIAVASGVHMPAQGGGWFYSSWVFALHHNTGLSTTAHTAGLPISTTVVKSAIKLKSSVREALWTELAINSECSVEEMLTDGLYDAHSFVQPIVKSAVAELERRVHRKEQAQQKQLPPTPPKRAPKLGSVVGEASQAASLRSKPGRGPASPTKGSNSWQPQKSHSNNLDRWGQPLVPAATTGARPPKTKSVPLLQNQQKSKSKRNIPKSPGDKWLQANPLADDFGLTGSRVGTKSSYTNNAEAGAQFEDDEDLLGILEAEDNFSPSFLDPSYHELDPSFHELVADVTNITNKLATPALTSGNTGPGGKPLMRMINSQGVVVEAMAAAQVTVKNGQLSVTPFGASSAREHAIKEVSRRIDHHISSSDQIHDILDMVSSKRLPPDLQTGGLQPAQIRYDRKGQVYREK